MDDRTLEITAITGLDGISAAEWDACACPEAADGGPPNDPFTTLPLPPRRWKQADPWDPAPAGRPGILTCAGGRRRSIGCRAALCQGPQPGRVHLRSQLGPCLGAGRRALLSQAADRRPLHPSDGTAFPGEAGIRGRGHGALGARRPQDCRAERSLVGPCNVLHAGRGAARQGNGSACTVSRSSFTGRNEGYGDFEAFLAELSSRKRKTIRKERRVAQSFGGDIVALSGDDLRPEHWDAFWTFYQDTGAASGGRPI